MFRLKQPNDNVCKNSIDENFLKECDSEVAMEQLYALFDVTPAAPVIKHSGEMPIIVDENLSVDQQHHALWEFLVPVSGKCATIQGEVIRITGRIDNESKGNAGVNWDTEYRKMLKALLDYLRQGTSLDEEDIQATQQAINSIDDCKACGCWDETDRLKELSVKWVKQNPTPIFLDSVNYRRQIDFALKVILNGIHDLQGEMEK